MVDFLILRLKIKIEFFLWYLMKIGMFNKWPFRNNRIDRTFKV